MKNSIKSSRKDTRPKNSQKNRYFKNPGTKASSEGTSNLQSRSKAAENKSQSKKGSKSKSK